MKTTIELLEELSKKSKAELEWALVSLMTQEKIDFINVQGAYVQYLEILKEKNLSCIVEAETCILESLVYDKIPTKDTSVEKSVQRRLYFLNKSRRFNTNKLNEKFKYDEERAKTYNHEEDNPVRLKPWTPKLNANK